MCPGYEPQRSIRSFRYAPTDPTPNKKRLWNEEAVGCGCMCDWSGDFRCRVRRPRPAWCAAYGGADDQALGDGERAAVAGRCGAQGDDAYARRRAAGDRYLPSEERARSGADHLRAHAVQLQLLGCAKSRAGRHDGGVELVGIVGLGAKTRKYYLSD